MLTLIDLATMDLRVTDIRVTRALQVCKSCGWWGRLGDADYRSVPGRRYVVALHCPSCGRGICNHDTIYLYEAPDE